LVFPVVGWKEQGYQLVEVSVHAQATGFPFTGDQRRSGDPAQITLAPKLAE
jgi:hypothetical protein